VHPNLEHNRTLRPTADTEHGGPRQRADALGPPPETGKRLGNGSGPTAQGEPPDPALGPLDADLRQRLGERFEYLAAVKLAGHSKDAITLSVLTTYQADNIRRHCQADILAVAGASELKFEVILPEPVRKRR
jgi:hypothetical protein